MHQLLFLEAMTRDELFLETARKEIPEAWHTLEMDVEAEGPKEKVTLYLDRAVIQMFRKMGKGYQARPFGLSMQALQGYSPRVPEP